MIELEDHLPNAPGDETFREAVGALADNVLATADFDRSDRLWPADVTIFQTNALNLTCGACGTALFLHAAQGELPPEVREWLLARQIDEHSHPPGLYSGIAGVAWSFLEMGMTERAVELIRCVERSPLLFGADDVHDGAAGWGLAALAFYARTGDERPLALAVRAAEHLTDRAIEDDRGVHWQREGDQLERLGFAYGGSGIALFLLYASVLTGEARYRTLARRAMSFEVAHGQARGEGLVWGVSTDDEGNRPYWLRGGGGVTSALTRFYRVLGEPEYLDLARRGARGCSAFFSAAPHLFEGLASMGETLLDVYLASGEESFLEAARLKAEQALLFAVSREPGIAFPGRYLMRISHDLGTGGAGVGLFLHRLVRSGPRPFHDFGTLPDAAPASLASEDFGGFEEEEAIGR